VKTQYTYYIVTLDDLQLDAQNSCLFTYNTFIYVLYVNQQEFCASSWASTKVTHFMFNNFFFNHSVHEILEENVVRPVRSPDGTKIRHMRISCWITWATDTHSEYVFIRQQ
jgi:hypothetical protein